MPASLTSATFLPSESILSSAGAADFSREFSLTNISFFSPSLLSRTPVTRVSSQATTSHSASVSLARSEISARLPIGRRHYIERAGFHFQNAENGSNILENAPISRFNSANAPPSNAPCSRRSTSGVVTKSRSRHLGCGTVSSSVETDSFS